MPFYFLAEMLSLASAECGSPINNTLKSPGYPKEYPGNMYCTYSVPIPPGMALKITLDDLELEMGEDCK